MPKTSFRKNSDSPLRLIIADYYAEKNWNGSNDSSPYWKKFKDLATKQPALRLSRTKNLHFAKATFPGFSAIVGSENLKPRITHPAARKAMQKNEGGDKIKGHPTRRQVIWSQCSDPLLGWVGSGRGDEDESGRRRHWRSR
jgi:hypothetical protein